MAAILRMLALPAVFLMLSLTACGSDDHDKGITVVTPPAAPGVYYYHDED